jgi:predicted metal-dependent phosphoesterase TrpH
MIRVDCHSHTGVSWDSLTGLRRYLIDAEAAGLDAVFVTDHGTLDGYRRLLDLQPRVRLIPGVEVSTAAGELLAYFIEEVPPAGQSIEATVEFVHERGGLVVLPHIGARTAPDRIKPPALWHALEWCDAVEGLNARVEAATADARAREWAARFGKPITAGSDAHGRGNLGNAHLEMEDFTDAADFFAKLPAARLVLRRRATIWGNLAAFGLALLVSGNFWPSRASRWPLRRLLND